MMMRMTAAAVAALMAGTQGSLAQEEPATDQTIALPAVSADADLRRRTSGSTSQSLDTLQTITVQPGVNELIQVAIGHPNRIVTPFKAPRVVTSATAVVETSEHVIYVVPAHASPVTMFVTETGDEGNAISLTLLPREIPPRELRLQLPPGVSPPKAAAWSRKNQRHDDRSYAVLAGKAFDKLANGQLPDDFAFSEEAPHPHPLCAAENGFEVAFGKGQYLLGANQEIYIGVVRNGGSTTAVFQEPWCYSTGVIAVALWPRAHLQPGEAAEIYLARALAGPEAVPSAGARPSLIGASP